jgi:hypothetical protein
MTNIFVTVREKSEENLKLKFSCCLRQTNNKMCSYFAQPLSEKAREIGKGGNLLLQLEKMVVFL